MNTPARFESLLWMASPMMAWAQASQEAPPSPPAATKPETARPAAETRSRGKRGKATA